MQDEKLGFPQCHRKWGMSNILTTGTHRVHIKTYVWI